MPVAQDKEAFDQIRGRLEGDVGSIFAAVQAKTIGHVPFWTLVRCLFPIAESIADLIHDSTAMGTAKALTLLLEKELENVRSGYKKVAGTLTVMYRHSLTHQDEMRIIKTKGRQVFWKIHNAGGHHLKVTPENASTFTIEFDPKAFYDDLVALLAWAGAQAWGGGVKDRYNNWFTLDLDKKVANGQKLTGAEKAAIVEIAAL